MASTIGRKLSDAGLRVMGVPKTIDNDLEMTDATFGFDTAVEVATEGIDLALHDGHVHSRVFVVELMGRYAGWIASTPGWRREHTPSSSRRSCST